MECNLARYDARNKQSCITSTARQGMKGITLNEKALEHWTRSLCISSVMEHNILVLKESTQNKDSTYHKEKSPRIKSDDVFSYLLWPFFL